VNFSNEKGTPIVIGCDANLRHVVWGSTVINSRGAAMLEYLFATHLDILNRGNKPTLLNRVRTQSIFYLHMTRGAKLACFLEGLLMRPPNELSSDLRPPYQYRNL
jgi:hypothetical protein